ncbi:hypothetical protein PENTCL1PPCAC_1079, partial [Pristionchus entomophagus]
STRAMLWPLLSLLFFLLPYLGTALERPIDACPEKRVCTIFLNDSCTVNGKETPEAKRGYLWEAATTCKKSTYNYYFAGLEFEPFSLQRWRVVVTTWVDIWHGKQNLGLIRFNFDRAEFAFPNETTMKFTWRNGDSVHSSFHSLTNTEPIESDGYNFERYSFEIEAGGENLINLFAVDEFDMVPILAKHNLTLRDPRFSQSLKELCNCTEGGDDKEEGEDTTTITPMESPTRPTRPTRPTDSTSSPAAAPTTTTSSQPDDVAALLTTAISVGSACAALLVILIVIIVIIVCVRKSKKKKMEEEDKRRRQLSSNDGTSIRIETWEERKERERKEALLKISENRKTRQKKSKRNRSKTQSTIQDSTTPMTSSEMPSSQNHDNSLGSFETTGAH